ncbi:phosphatase 2C-domain-containing protein [Phycomyces nitens]|nr:phosphatase 2C-domain-containing protein [Phycomyces nitens]
MGQTLSEPITEKESEEGESQRVIYAASAMQGWRISMEDAHITIAEDEETHASLFAVFDGHGGAKTAKYSKDHIPDLLLKSEAFKKGCFRDALGQSFLGIDESLRKDPQYVNDPSGCTAVVALLTSQNTLFVSNAGDSRAVICTDGQALALSQDHKPTDPKETERIENAGGFVRLARVNGKLALSRALGDFDYKMGDLPPEQQIVTAVPDIVEHPLTNKDDFLILACDGIWDCMTNNEVVIFVQHYLGLKTCLKDICERLMDNCLSTKRGQAFGQDNMTVILVGFLNGTSEKWYESMAEKYKDVKLPETTYPTATLVKRSIREKDVSEEPNNSGISTNVVLYNDGSALQKKDNDTEPSL